MKDAMMILNYDDYTEHMNTDSNAIALVTEKVLLNLTSTVQYQ